MIIQSNLHSGLTHRGLLRFSAVFAFSRCSYRRPSAAAAYHQNQKGLSTTTTANIYSPAWLSPQLAPNGPSGGPRGLKAEGPGEALQCFRRGFSDFPKGLNLEIQVSAEPFLVKHSSKEAQYYKTHFNALWIKKMAPPGTADLGETIKHEFNSQQAAGGDLGFLSALLSRLLELGSGDNSLQYRALEGSASASKLLLDIHYFKEYYHITALLGRGAARLLANKLNPQFKSTVALRYIPVPYYLNTVENGVNQRYDLHVKLVDWSRLDPGADSLETCCARFELPLPLKSPLVFHELREAFRRRVGLISEKLGIPLKAPERPQGTGTLVASLLNQYLSSCAEPEATLLQALNVPGVKEKSKVHEMFSSVYGVKALTTGPLELTKSHLGTVVGGRIMQEEYGQKVHPDQLVVDIDIEACYGTALSALSYPIGHPTLMYFSRYDPLKWPSLRAFLEKWEDELVPHCWMAVVETTDNLGFNQDFLMSKMTLGELGEPTIEDEPGEGHIQGAAKVLLNEVKNGVLTSSSLALLRAAASSEEWGELKTSLRVKAAMIYPKSHLADNYVEWKSLMKHGPEARNLRTFCTKDAHGIIDCRPGPWLKVSLEPFVKPLLELRRNCPSEQSGKYFKLLVNSVFGILGSPYYPENNPVVANNITDLARAALWLMVKSSNASLSVTDGCAAVLNQFPIGKAKPGLNALCSPTQEYGPLGKKHWGTAEAAGNLNQLSLQVPLLFRKHLKSWVNGFQSKKLTQVVDLFSYKVKRIGNCFVMHGAGNYSLTELDGNVVYKMRGHQLNAPHYCAESGTPVEPPGKKLLDALHQSPESTLAFAKPHTSLKIAALGDYKRKGASGFLPGDYIMNQTRARGILSSSFNFPDHTLRKKWERRYQSNSKKYGFGLEMAYIKQDGHYNYEYAVDDINRRISEGLGPPNLTKETRALLNTWRDTEKQKPPVLPADLSSACAPAKALIASREETPAPSRSNRKERLIKEIDEKVSDSVIEKVSDSVFLSETIIDIIKEISYQEPTRQYELIKEIKRLVRGEPPRISEKAQTGGGSNTPSGGGGPSAPQGPLADLSSACAPAGEAPAELKPRFEALRTLPEAQLSAAELTGAQASAAGRLQASGGSNTYPVGMLRANAQPSPPRISEKAQTGGGCNTVPEGLEGRRLISLPGLARSLRLPLGTKRVGDSDMSTPIGIATTASQFIYFKAKASPRAAGSLGEIRIIQYRSKPWAWMNRFKRLFPLRNAPKCVDTASWPSLRNFILPGHDVKPLYKHFKSVFQLGLGHSRESGVIFWVSSFSHITIPRKHVAEGEPGPKVTRGRILRPIRFKSKYRNFDSKDVVQKTRPQDSPNQPKEAKLKHEPEGILFPGQACGLQPGRPAGAKKKPLGLNSSRHRGAPEGLEGPLRFPEGPEGPVAQSRCESKTTSDEAIDEGKLHQGFENYNYIIDYTEHVAKGVFLNSGPGPEELIRRWIEQSPAIKKKFKHLLPNCHLRLDQAVQLLKDAVIWLKTQPYEVKITAQDDFTYLREKWAYGEKSWESAKALSLVNQADPEAGKPS